MPVFTYSLAASNRWLTIPVAFTERNILDLERTTERDFDFLVKVRILEKIKNITGRLQDSLTKKVVSSINFKRKFMLNPKLLAISRHITANPSPDRISSPLKVLSRRFYCWDPI